MPTTKGGNEQFDHPVNSWFGTWGSVAQNPFAEAELGFSD
jgi:hypothetical protein